MKNINVLITSAGVTTAVNVMTALNKSNKYKCRFVAVDMDPYATGFLLADAHYLISSSNSINYKDELARIIKSEKIDYIFVLHSSETLIFSEFIDLFDALGVGVALPPINAVDCCVDKLKFSAFLKDNGFDHPRLLHRMEDVRKFPVFLKPRVGSSSSGARIIFNKNELRFYVGNKFNNFVVQEYIDWQELTIDCYVNRNGVLVGCVPRYRLRVKDGKSIVAKTMFRQDVINESKKLLGALQYQGACNIQMFTKGNDLKIIEINPRLAAGGLPLTTEAGVNIPEMMIDDFFFKLSDELLPYNHNLTMCRYLTEVFV